MLLHSYDSLSRVDRILLASKTLPQRSGVLCHGRSIPPGVMLQGWTVAYPGFSARGMNFWMLFRFGGGVAVWWSRVGLREGKRRLP
jgi:hypothetical protein